MTGCELCAPWMFLAAEYERLSRSVEPEVRPNWLPAGTGAGVPPGGDDIANLFRPIPSRYTANGADRSE